MVLILLLQVATVQELRDAVGRAKPGAKILVASGNYEGSLSFQNLRGITIAGADPRDPPVFQSLHLSCVEQIELRDIAIRGGKGNGLNIDDGGKYGTPSKKVVLKNLTVTDIGSGGNQDGIKLSGVDEFSIEGCTIERWGGGGSGIDMVGCHQGRIEGNTLRNGGASGIQMKGGCAEIVVRRNRFENAGSRAINAGGSTGLQYFRPPLQSPPHAEARAITIEGNTFVGSDAAVAFVGVDGAIVRHNTIYDPKRWPFRILQETTEPGFVPCRKGEISRNLIVFRSGAGDVNVGPNTEPKSFTFSRNYWYCMDNPDRRPRLPTEERDGVHGRDPLLREDLRLRDDSPAREFGAGSLR